MDIRDKLIAIEKEVDSLLNEDQDVTHFVSNPSSEETLEKHFPRSDKKLLITSQKIPTDKKD